MKGEMASRIASALVVGITLAASRPAGAGNAADGADRPYGIETRIAWSASRVHGSPEPPLPFQTRRAFPQLTFHNPLDIAFAPGSNRVFVAEQFGRIYSFPNDEGASKADLCADLPSQVKGLDKVPFSSGVGAVYGITFHPRFRENHYVYICYVLNFKAPPDGTPLTPKNQQGSRISRFTVTDTNPPRIDPDSERVLIAWYAGGHNGGCIKFGPDGYLYISTGDGADPDPPDSWNTGQDISDLLSSILRIDVDHPSPDGKPYSIPSDNPFVHTAGTRPEVFAYGLRNPWRMSFDRRTGNLWVGDVGWELWESVVCAKSGGNYGWSIMEGPNPVHPNGQQGPTPLIPPQISLSHAEAASLTGGIVYHGRKLAALDGYYIFGDWQTSRLWAARCDGEKLQPHRQIAQTDQRIVAFGEQDDGELLVVDHGGGGLWRIVPNEASGQPSDFPRKLSQTGLFANLKGQTPQQGVIPFSINASQWVDGAVAQRWIAIPGADPVVWGKGVWGEDKPAWPKDSVLVRTLSMQNVRIETQLLHFDGRQWQGYSYAWNDQQTDADLVDSTGDARLLTIPDAAAPGGIRRQQWHFTSRVQCMTCHNVWSDYALAFNSAQLDRDAQFPRGTDNQVRTFRHLGLLIAPPPRSDDASGERTALTDPYDSSANLNERARSYLHANCSQCHRFGGGGSALFDVRKELPVAQLHLVNAKPNLGAFGIDDGKLVYPGDPTRSVLLYRISKLGTGRMPHIGSDVVDEKGLKLIRQWIRRLGGDGRDSAPAHAGAALSVIESGTAPTAQVTAAVEQLLSSTSGAMALVEALDDGKLRGPALRAAIHSGLASKQDLIRDLFRRFDPAEQQTNRLGPNIHAAKLLALRGDAARGGRIFFEQGGAGLCARCHVVNGRGTAFGPDLSHIATKYNRADLLDNIIFPSKTIAPGYGTYIVRTRSGETYSGLLAGKTDKEVILKDAQLKQYQIPSRDVERIVAQPISAMPDGLLADLDPQQAADLLEFVASLK